ncbi:MAG: DegT/DnrJ/EryC1/StrS family aminotransferase [Acidobacteriota bacterium]
MSRIYLSPPHMSGRERELVADAFDSNWVAPIGPHVNAFEQEMAEVVEVPHAAALSSGTAALHLAMELLGVGAGDEVMCASLTFAASVNPVVYQGAQPVLVDCDPETWTLDPHLVAQELEERGRSNRLPKALIAVDLYGQCADYEPLLVACERWGVPLIEDAAEALGSTYRGRPAGGFGRLGVFSFNGNKIITTSGGGMLVSHERRLVERARFLATQARDPAPHYEHSVIGYNYRLSNLLAAVGRGQLEVLDQRVTARRRNFERYRELLDDLPGLEFMAEATYGRSNRWLTCLTLDPEIAGTDREAVRLALEGEDIEARPVWKPMHLQPVFRDCPMVGGAVSRRLFEQGLCLPSGSSLASRDLERVAGVVRAVVTGQTS